MKRIEDLNTFYNCAMAVMYESIILCVIGIVHIHTSAAYHINTNICLTTAVRFINDQYRCGFQSYYADATLKDGVTCTNKCNVQIIYLDNQYTYYVSQVHVTIGNEQTITQSICDSSHMAYLPRNMYIKCSSWNKDKYRVMNTTDCQLNGAQCERIDKYCICHCYHGLSIINGSCLKGNVTIGKRCVADLQCTGTQYASLCQNGLCSCRLGYATYRNSCFLENVTVGDPCVYPWQCRGTKFASVCNHNGRCECQAGYILNGNSCFQGNVTIGKRCVSDLQCTGTQYASLCQNALCSCRLGYATYRNSCSLAQNVIVGHSCLYNLQCTGTQFASVCDHYQCECQSGYILIDNNCYPESIPVGGFCSHNNQCTGSEHAESCQNSKCRCSNGYILIDFECKKGNMTIKQPCLHNRQCTGTKFAGLCRSGKCTCATGYVLIENNCYKDNNIGKILGTLFGGIFIGVILTAVIAFLLFKKMQTKIRMRYIEEPSVSFANDVIYSSAIVVEHEDITASQANDKKQKVVNELPYACSEKGAVYGFVNRKPRTEQPTTEGVYNHLHEEEKHDNEHDDNYDHACAASYLGTEPSVYSNMP